MQGYILKGEDLSQLALSAADVVAVIFVIALYVA